MTPRELALAAEKIAGKVKEARMRADPMHDEVSIKLNRQPNYTEIENMKYFLGMIEEAGYDIVPRI